MKRIHIVLLLSCISFHSGHAQIEDGIASILLQPDGKILLTGANYNFYGINVYRFNNNGSPDKDFGNNGVAKRDFPGFSAATCIALQPNGKIVVAGFNSHETSGYYALVRYNNDGSPDESFGMQGQSKIEVGRGNVKVVALAIQADGKILVTGEGTAESSSGEPIKCLTLIRLDDQGDLDENFGNNGIVKWAYKTDNNIASQTIVKSLALQKDGKVILTGKILGLGTYTNKDYDYLFTIRFTPNGELDESFGKEGVVTSRIHNSYNPDEANFNYIQNDGKILVAGRTFYETDEKSHRVVDAFSIKRYNKNGSLDLTFGTGGSMLKNNYDGPYFGNSVYALLQQPDKKFIITGKTSKMSLQKTLSISNLIVLRINSDGTIDNSFGQKGLKRFEFGEHFTGSSLALQPDGKLLIGALLTNGYNSGLCITRLLTNGELDMSFGNKGMVTVLKNAFETSDEQ